MAVAGRCGLFRVILIPCFGRFMCPFTVAGLGFKYLRINVSLMPGHPFKYLCCVAFNREDFFGLHNKWCANLMVLACVVMECVNIVIDWGGGGKTFSGGGSWQRLRLHMSSWQLNIFCLVSDVGVVPIPPRGICNIHRSVEGSLEPVRITLSL